MDYEIELQRELEAAAPELWDKMMLRAQWNCRFLPSYRPPQECDDLLQRVIGANEVVWAMWRDPDLTVGL